MPAVTREIEVTYNGITLGGSSNRLIHEWHFVNKGYKEAEFFVKFLVTGASAAALATECSTIEAAFRTPRQDLVVTMGGSTFLSLKQSDNTGLDAEPQIEKSGEDGYDTARSRMYTLRLAFTMPADNVATSGLQESRVNVQYTPARKKRIVVSGTVTAVPAGSTARAQYEAVIDGFAAAAIAAIGGTFELAEEPESEHNSTNKTMTFVRVYDEVIYSQAGSADDAGIVRPSLHIIKDTEASGQAPGAVPLATVTATYDFWVDKEVTQNLRSKWNAVRPWLITQMRAVLGGGAMSIRSEQVDYDFTENKISARLTAKGLNGSNVVAYHLVVRYTTNLGKVLVPVWDQNPYSRYKYQGPSEKKRVTTKTAKVLGIQPPDDPFRGIANLFSYNLPTSEAGGVWEEMHRESSASPEREGLPGDFQDYSNVEEVVTEQFFVPVKTAPGGGGGPFPSL